MVYCVMSSVEGDLYIGTKLLIAAGAMTTPAA